MRVSGNSGDYCQLSSRPEMMSDAQLVDRRQTKQAIIDKYITSVQKLRLLVQAKYAISAIDFDEYLYHNFFEEYLENGQQEPRQQRQSRISPQKDNLRSYGEFVANSVWMNRRQYCAIMIVVAICILLVNYKLEASNFFMRNIQNMIYPGMRAWRILTLPLIQTFPSLTQFYDETCLISNPLFQVDNLNCRPCERTTNVLDLTRSANMNHYLDSSTPYVIKVRSPFQCNDLEPFDCRTFSSFQTNHTAVTIPMLYQIYNENRKIFHEDAYTVRSSQSHIANLDQLFTNLLNHTTATVNVQSHHLWRINRMTPARILRRLFPKPLGLPETAGIGVERFLAIDTSLSPSYILPETDCSNMFVLMAKGSRTIHFRPTKECQATCRSLSFRLEENTFCK